MLDIFFWSFSSKSQISDTSCIRTETNKVEYQFDLQWNNTKVRCYIENTDYYAEGIIRLLPCKFYILIVFMSFYYLSYCGVIFPHLYRLTIITKIYLLRTVSGEMNSTALRILILYFCCDILFQFLLNGFVLRTDQNTSHFMQITIHVVLNLTFIFYNTV